MKTPLKDMIVEYVGLKLQPENEEVTHQMVLECLAEEFPEVMLIIAEENFLAGYKNALEEWEGVEDVLQENDN
jgi:hypothetical protein